MNDFRPRSLHHTLGIDEMNVRVCPFLLRAFCSTLFILAEMAVPAHADEITKAAPPDFIVAVDGRDDWSGTLTSPNGSKTDGPFATISRARDAVRVLKKTSPKEHITVSIRGGRYTLSETLVFSLEDTAVENGSITYSAYMSERPIISSGVPITGWRRLEKSPANLPEVARGKVWVADLPAGIDHPYTLYDGDHRLPRARGEGFAPIDPDDRKTFADKFIFPPGALRDWSDLSDAELLVIPTADYEMCILPIASIDETTHVVITKVPATRPIGKVKFVPVSVWLENVLGVLDEPGEWVVNTLERKIYLWPNGNEPGELIVAPKLTELVRVEGDIHEDGPTDKPVTGLKFQGLTFSQAERYPWHGGTGSGLQHHWEIFDRPTAVLRFRGASSCIVERCQFTNTSGTGIRLDLTCQKNRLIDNEISHVGGVGILLAGYGPGTKDVNRQNEVSNNWIHHTGEIYWATPAITIWQSGENHVASNLIHHTPYSAITVSTRAGWNRAKPESDRTVRWAEIAEESLGDWQVREPYLHSRKNVVERNDIHEIMQIMGDGDGIYISGTGRENVIRQNYIHHNDSDGMADGIRCDDDQNETIIEGNIIYHVRCIGQGICSKGVNHIVNNIIADLLPSRRPIRPERVVRGYIGLEVNPVTGSRVERNIVVARHNTVSLMIQDRRYGRGAEPLLRECKADNNVYYCFDDPEWGLKHLRTEQAHGVETHSLMADPLFEDFDKGDLRLKSDSPALRLGFQPTDLSTIGLRANHPYHHTGESTSKP